MVTNNSANQDYINNADGYTLGGGTTERKLTITGADVTLTGSGTNVFTMPAATDTLVGRASTDTLTNKTLTAPVFSGTITGTYTQTQEAWTAVTFTNSWVDFGGTAQTCAYMKDTLGFVHLKGLMKTGSIGAAAFTLPAGYRPLAYARFSTVSNGAFGTADLPNTGVFTPQAGSSISFSLDGITFRAEN